MFLFLNKINKMVALTLFIFLVRHLVPPPNLSMDSKILHKVKDKAIG